METKADVSYGVIPVIQEAGQWKVFLINQYGSTGDVYWTFPKGHPESGELPMDAALRELQEETGIELSELLEDRIYIQEYTYMYGQTRIEKCVEYYLGIARDPHFRIQEDEVKEAGWFSKEEAVEKLTYEHARDMFRQVQSDLHDLEGKL